MKESFLATSPISNENSEILVRTTKNGRRLNENLTCQDKNK